MPGMNSLAGARRGAEQRRGERRREPPEVHGERAGDGEGGVRPGPQRPGARPHADAREGMLDQGSRALVIQQTCRGPFSVVSKPMFEQNIHFEARFKMRSRA